MIVIKDLIVITGPTASGKTALSVELAIKLGAEIVNADSMQIYKYMDIGTAKPTFEERKGIPHHLIDIVNPDELFSVARYCECAKEVIDDIHSRGKVAIMVGGTGLYVDSLVNNIQFSEIEPDEEYRRKMEDIAEQKGNEHIFKMLEKIDPESALKVEVSDRKRIIRALEVYHLTGKTITWHNERSRSVPSPYNTT
ncbi:MAG: tRNA (adenosine(37)-N6)-dimethylallyltransferase MiaA, partial [Clostridia bacterium]|nr:tRNA (adenosine(37)-N6)-dimethylallyltransferase MiaA [Clostridia bacterium]